MLSTGPAVVTMARRTAAPSLAKVCASRLDELLIVASGGADGHAQGGRAQDDEGRPDDGGKQQQSGGEHQKKRASFAATERQIAGARQAV